MTESSQPSDTIEKSDSRESLLLAAEELFSARGYEGVSTRELAERANVNLGAIQYHFGSKGKLFIETVHRMMRRTAGSCASYAQVESILDERDAAAHLGRFVGEMMSYLLRPVGPQGCRVMFRETFSKMSNDQEMFDALVSSVVNDFTKPSHQRLVEVLKMLLGARAGDMDLHAVAFSVVGQCFFYVTHQPFIERLTESSINASPKFDRIVEHILKFSLHALGCADNLIEVALAASRQCQSSSEEKVRV